MNELHDMERPLTRNISADRTPLDFAAYEKAGGYRAVLKALKTMSPEQVTESVKKSNLRGRGGAGFPTGMKWSFVPMGDDAPHPKYLVVNADEMEPGTFKDRLLLEGDPHQIVEAVIVSAYAVQADVAYVFIRAAYGTAARRLNRALAEAKEHGYVGRNILDTGWSLEVYVHVSAGRYICGEETGLLTALEGKRPLPRTKPPYPQAVGLWGQPTVVNNVETLANVPHITNHGPEWFKNLSHSEDGGTKLYGASGRVRNPGVWELPMGTPIREILEDYAGGMRDGYGFRAVLPGGASTGFLVDEHLDLVMDFDTISDAGSRLGTGMMIVFDDRTCVVGALANLEHFFAQESCGWCTPCRDGLPWVERTLKGIEAGKGTDDDLEILDTHIRGLGMGCTFCAHAPGAMMPLETALRYFRDDFERHLAERRCPWRR